MSKINHILLSTDGSKLSMKAARYGGDLARALDARMTILTVLNEQLVVPGAWAGAAMGAAVGTSSTETIRRQMETAAIDNDLAQTAAEAGELKVPANLIYEWGHTATEICNYADENAVDLIVIGSHGRTGIKAALLGSVSHAVVNRASCAVTVVR